MKNTRLLVSFIARTAPRFLYDSRRAERKCRLRKVNTIKIKNISVSLRVEHTNYCSGTLVIGTIKYKLPPRMGSISWNHRLLAEVFISFNTAASKTFSGDTNQWLSTEKITG
jgi:hypothetical protein